MDDGMHRKAEPGAVPGGGCGAVGSSVQRIDWDGLMRLGLGALRLPPDQFWAMTPGEFCRALQGAGLHPVPGLRMERSVLERLMAAHPDTAR